MTISAIDTTSPYPGPRSFRTEEELYGRTAEAEQLVRQLIAERIVLLHSPSGAGKTSLLHAKVRSMLEGDGFYVLPDISVGDEVHEDQERLPPNRYLASAVASLKEGFDRAGENLTVGERFATTLASARQHSDRGECVVFFDQFEQLVTKDLHDSTAKFEFMRELGEALQQRSIWAVFAIREDYVPALDPYLHVIPTRLSSRFRLDFLTRDEAREAIEEPARAAGRPFEASAANGEMVDPVDLLLDDLQGAEGPLQRGYIEPLHLQVACRQLWSRLSDGTAITAADVQSLGSVDEALRSYIDDEIGKVAAASGVNERRLRQWFDSELVVGSFRRQTLEGPLGPASIEDELIQALLDTHLVRTFSRGRAMWLELAHDRLVDPVKASNQVWRRSHLTLLERSAETWEERGRPTDALLTGHLLRRATKEAARPEADLTSGEQAFLQRSRARNRRRLLWLGVAGLVAFSMFVLVVTALVAASRSQSRAIAAEAAELLALDPAMAVEKALEARTGLLGTREAEAVLRRAIPADSLHAVLVGHTGPVVDVAVSPDGTKVATASLDGTARLWDAADGRALATLDGHTDRVNSVEFSGDGSRVVTTSHDTTARIWDVESGEQAVVLSGTGNALTRATFHPAGDRVVGVGWQNEALVWDAASGDIQTTLAHDDWANSAAFSPDGSHIVTASWDGTARVWDATSGRELASHVHSFALGGVFDASFSQDGRLVATAAQGDSVVWNWTDDVSTPLLPQESHDVVDVEVVEDRLVVIASGITATLWMPSDDFGFVQSRDPLLGHTDWVNGVAVDPTRRVMATWSRDGTARIWEVGPAAELAVLRGHTDEIVSGSFSPDGRFFVTAGADGTARIWRLPAAAILRGHTDWVNAAVVAEDGRVVVSAGSDGTVRSWSVDDGTEIETERIVDPAQTRIADIAVDEGNTHVAIAGGLSGRLGVWDRASDAEVANRTFSVGGVWSVDFHPDGRRLVAVGDGVASIWTWADPEAPVMVLAGHEHDSATSAEFSRDGSRVATAGWDGRAMVWDVSTGALISEMEGHTGAVWDISFSPDGSMLASASGDRTARIWDTATGEQVRVLSGHASHIMTTAFSPDGKRVVTGAADGTTGVWDVESGANLAILKLHAALVTEVLFHPDGETIVSASDDHTIRLYGCPSCVDRETLAAMAEDRVGYTDALRSSLLTSVPRFDREIDQSDLRRGDCLLGMADLEDPEGLTPVPCQDEHEIEVIAMIQHPTGSAVDQAPDDFWGFAETHCTRAFSDYVGLTPPDSSLEVGWHGWETTDRRIICWLTDPAGPMVGSMRDARR